LEIANDYILVVKIGAAAIVLVLAAGFEHATGRAVERPFDYFPKEAELPGSNHVLDAWDVVQHLAYHFISKMLFPHIDDEDVENLLNTLIEEDFKAAEEILPQRPVLTSPEE
jgi:hypothetical protein